MTDLPTYVLERTFVAPPELVWRSWTDPALLARWYGPRSELVIHHSDLRPGGQTRLEMRWGGAASFQRFDYLTVEPPSHLRFVMVSADAAWAPAPPAHQPDWPVRLLTDVTLTSIGSQTAMRLTWTPDQATATEIAFFAAALNGLGRGWGSGMEALAALLADLQA